MQCVFNPTLLYLFVWLVLVLFYFLCILGFPHSFFVLFFLVSLLAHVCSLPSVAHLGVKNKLLPQVGCLILRTTGFEQAQCHLSGFI